MTKKELEKEADKYADNYATPDLDCSFRAHMFEASALGYPAGAEPREKQIAELTEQNTSLLTSVENLNKSVQELEKENAELKEELKKWKDEWQEQVQKANDEGYARTLQTMQLTKEKEIIKKLIEAIHIWDCKNLEEVEAEAEQFLNEVEK